MNTTLKTKRLPALLAGLILFCLVLTGCFSSKESDAQIQKSFDHFLNEVFVSEIQQDGLTFNYSLSHPENYGIEAVPDTLGDYSLDSMKANLASTENYLSTLKSFSYRQLTEDQQLTYDIFKEYLTLQLEGADYLLYESSLSKSIGLQAQLPVLFAEYNFYNKASVTTYLSLLSDIERYYEDILAFEELKIKNNLFMSHDTAGDIISQCKNFVSKKENNLLIEVFNDRIETVEGLTDTEKKAFCEENKNIVLNSVIPSYKNMISFLTQYQDSGVNSQGLCYFPEGKEYYQHLVSTSTGSSKSIKEIDQALDDCLNASIETMQRITIDYPNILEQSENVSFPEKDPAKILSYLEEAITTNYPVMEPVDYSIKYVHESLQPDISPAFYLTPPIDDSSINSIYINPYKDYEMDSLFSTLAHEGYPGHLYQNVYFNRTSPSPLRSLLNYTGYSEGWATYVEMDSYFLAGLEEPLCQLLSANHMATLCIYGKTDTGINYYGWDLAQTMEFLAGFGIKGEDTAQEIYQSMIAEPGNYLNYILGCIEFQELKEKAQKKLGDDFVLKDFHEFILSTGPASFDVLNDRLKDWIKTR